MDYYFYIYVLSGPVYFNLLLRQGLPDIEPEARLIAREPQEFSIFHHLQWIQTTQTHTAFLVGSEVGLSCLHSQSSNHQAFPPASMRLFY